MQCPRLKHFVRLNYDGTLSRCGHMANAPKFVTLEEMDSSEWQKNIASNMDAGIFPAECQRCRDTEQVQQQSIREYSLQEHVVLSAVKADYLVVGGILDNICNSACQSCNAQHSTKIGRLNLSDYYTTNNAEKFWQLPVERIVKLDINGGEPTASPAYQSLLENLPPNVTEVRVNTNGSRILPNLDKLIERGVRVTVTVSLDGIGRVHDYVRWPIKWDAFEKNLQYYVSLGNAIELNTWTTVHALNVGNLKDIIAYTQDNKINHAWAFLEAPSELNVKYSNHFTRTADVPEELTQHVATGPDNTVALQLWTCQQDHLRGIRLWDYYK